MDMIDESAQEEESPTYDELRKRYDDYWGGGAMAPSAPTPDAGGPGERLLIPA